MLRICTEPFRGARWLKQYRYQRPQFCCVLGFTQTGLFPGISAAGLSSADRQYTALADLEYLAYGPSKDASYPLPPLQAGASPVLISRALATHLQWPIWLMNAGSVLRPPFPCIDLGGDPAKCVSSGAALRLKTVLTLFQAGMSWGHVLAQHIQGKYLILSECVVGGTTTAMGVLTALGFDVRDKISSSHRLFHPSQKRKLVEQGLYTFGRYQVDSEVPLPFRAVAALGDPMQIAVAGLVIALSRSCGVLLAGGTQMLAVYALTRAIADATDLPWDPEQVVVGTTPWVADDPHADAIGLAKLIGDVPFITSNLSFKASPIPALSAYDQGYVKEGVGAGGSAIAAYLHRSLGPTEIVSIVEAEVQRYARTGCVNGGNALNSRTLSAIA